MADSRFAPALGLAMLAAVAVAVSWAVAAVLSVDTGAGFEPATPPRSPQLG